MNLGGTASLAATSGAEAGERRAEVVEPLKGLFSEIAVPLEEVGPDILTFSREQSTARWVSLNLVGIFHNDAALVRLATRRERPTRARSSASAMLAGTGPPSFLTGQEAGHRRARAPPPPSRPASRTASAIPRTQGSRTSPSTPSPTTGLARARPDRARYLDLEGRSIIPDDEP